MMILRSSFFSVGPLQNSELGKTAMHLSINMVLNSNPTTTHQDNIFNISKSIENTKNNN